MLGGLGKGRGGKKNEVKQATEDLDFAANDYQIELETDKGLILLDLWPDVAPGHCRNIIGLAKIGFYDGITFHRVIPGFVIQGGCPEGRGTGGPGYQIDAEFNDRQHEAGVLSMARSSDPNSAGSQFFLCLDRVPYLDNEYTGFGKAHDSASVEVIKAIGAVKTGAQDKPVEPVHIKKARVMVTAKN